LLANIGWNGFTTTDSFNGQAGKIYAF